jgi:hypothetical protein
VPSRFKRSLTGHFHLAGRLHLKRDGARAETRFRLSPKRTSPFKSAEASVQSTAGSRGGRISVSNAGYTTFRGSVKSTGYPLHSPVSPSLPLPASSCAIRFQAHSSFVLSRALLCDVTCRISWLLTNYLVQCADFGNACFRTLVSWLDSFVSLVLSTIK